MRIVDVEAFCLRLPSVEARSDSSQDALVVKVSTDAGIVGWGEVDSCPSVIKAIIDAPYSHTMATGLRSLLVGDDPMDPPRLWRRMYDATSFYGRSGAVIQAMAGVDLALWDVKGKALDLPVVELLGGRRRDAVRLYSSNMFQETIEATVERARRAVDTGHSAVKFGWEPFGRSAERDEEYLEAIRAAIGSGVDLMIDAGHAWDAPTTVARAERFRPYDLFWIEEPLPPDDYEGYGELAGRCPQRVAAGEQECTVAGFRRLIDVGRVDVVQIDVTRCGLTQAMEIAAYAHRRGVHVCNHNFTTHINTAASIHFLCAIAEAEVMEYCAEPNPLAQSLVRNPVPIADGMARLPAEPGLGVEPDPEVLARYRVRA